MSVEFNVLFSKVGTETGLLQRIFAIRVVSIDTLSDTMTNKLRDRVFLC